MKLTIFVFFVGVCLVAVNANGGSFVEPDADLDAGLGYIREYYADEILEVEDFGFKSTVKLALRSVKALNCSIKSALLMKAAAEQGLADIKACGGQVSKQLQTVINQLNKIVSIGNDIFNLNENVCNNENEDGNTSKPCFSKMLTKIWSLYRNINKCISMIKKVPTTGANASDCINTALSKVSGTFTQFPSFIQSCSQLTS